MTRLRLLIIGYGCLLAGLTLIYRSLTGIPAFDQLKTITGSVSFESRVRTYRGMSAKDTIFLIDGKAPGYAYLDWFPAIEDLSSRMRAGDTITVWYKESTDPWAWQINKGDTTIVPYQAVADAVKANNRFDPLLGIFVLALSALAFKKLRALRRAGAATPS